MMTLLAALLLAQVTLTIPEAVVLYDGFDTAKVGEQYPVQTRCGCNTCTYDYEKISETERRATGTGHSTLLACSNFPVEKVR